MRRGIFGTLTAIALVGLLGGAARADAPGDDGPKKAVKKSKSQKKKRRAAAPVFSGRVATADELRTQPLDRPSGHIEIQAVNFPEKLVVELYREDGSYDEDVLDELNHLWRCKRTGTEKPISPRLFEVLSHIYDHFGKPLELVSGYRNQHRTSSFHFHGSASDIRIAGVSEKELRNFAASLDTGGMGIGIYPKAGFIHVDIRPEPSFRWVDYSPPGTNDMGRPHHRRHKKSRVASNT